MREISVDDIILEVRNMLSVWFDTHKVDESILYPVARQCLAKMGKDNTVEKDAVIYISGRIGDLPLDLKNIIMAVSCVGKEYRRPVSEAVMTYETVQIDQDYSVYKDDCGLPSKVYRKVPYEVYEWDQFELLRVARDTVPKCHANCLNFLSKTDKTFSISGNKILVNFDTGLLYITYTAHSEELRVPDNETIINWVKKCMYVEVFTYLAYAGEPNIADRLSLAKQDRHIAEEQARPVWKRSEFQDFYSLRSRLMARFNTFSAGIINDTRYARFKYC